MVVAYNDIINAIARAEDVALYNARARAIELSNGCKPSKEDDDKAIEIESWIQLLTRAAANYDHETCLTDDIIWDIIQNVNEQNRDVDCDVSRTYSRNASSGGGSNVPSGYVERVLGLYVDNTNPSLPVIEIFVDPLTISGNGTQANPFSAIGGGGGVTNLGYTASPTDGTVTSSTGTDATLPLADGTNAGLLKPSHFSVLENENQASGYVGTDANNEILSSYYIEQINVVTAQALVAGSDLVSLKAYILDDADGGGRIIKVLAAAGVTNQFYQYAIDVTSGEIGTYDITTDVFTPIVSSSQTLADTLILGNTSGANDIQFDAAQGILLDNTSRLREGTIDAGLGGLKGIAQICGAGYELKWEAGRLYVMGSSGNTIRQSLYNFTTTPTSSDDNTLGYAVGSLWTLDDGTVYECTDASMGAAVWNLIATTPDLQQVTSIGATTTNNITVNASVGPVKTVIGVGGIGLTSPANATAGILCNSVATSYNAEMPNKSSNQTFAMLSDISSLVTSVSAGTNISVTGTSTAPIINSLSDRYSTSSISTNTINNNNGKIFIVDANLAYIPLQEVLIVNSPSNYHMHGTVVSYSGTTLTVDINSHTGTGTFSSWVINIDGVPVDAITGVGTANEIAYFTGGQVIASLPVATYPSLTELSRVKNVGSQVVGTTDTNTLTNKRITARSGTVASSATPTINTDNVDYYSITALAAAITSFTTNLSGTPTIGQTLWISITDNGTARAITWGASFEASTIALPTTTVISTRLDVAFIWNEATSKWRCVGVA